MEIQQNTKEKVLVSACLVGVKCRYNGEILEKRKLPIDQNVEIIVCCPEVLGELPIPRPPSFFTNNQTGKGVLKGTCKVISSENVDKTDNFLKGAKETLKLANQHGIKKAYFKERSPSCGVNCVYVMDRKEKGIGVTTALLNANGIAVTPVE